MKVLLIVPPEIIAIEPFRSSKRLRDCVKMIKGFPVGLGYIAAVLEKNNVEVEILDAQIKDLSLERITEEIRRISPQIIGITTYTANIKVAAEIARIAKDLDPSTKIVFGGAHAVHDYRNLLENYSVDCVVLGEGEFIFLNLVRAVEQNSPLNNAGGIAYKENTGIKVNPGNFYIEDLDALPLPARHLTDFNVYLKHFTHDLPSAAQILTSRGCPYSCAFCSSGNTFSKWRGRKAQNVIAEMESVLEHYPQVRSFSFMDDNFTLDKRRVEEVCNLLIKNGLNKYPWDCLSRCGGLDYRLLRLMKSAGCVRIQFGIESASEEILKNIDKALDLRQARETISLTRKAGIEAYGFFMIGNPGETEESIRKSVDFALHSKLTYVNWFVTQVYPGTKLAKLQGQPDWVRYVYEPEITCPSLYTHPCVPVFCPEGFDRERLKAEVAVVMKKFFLAYLPRNFAKWLRKLVCHPLYGLWYLKRILTER